MDPSDGADPSDSGPIGDTSAPSDPSGTISLPDVSVIGTATPGTPDGTTDASLADLFSNSADVSGLGEPIGNINESVISPIISKILKGLVGMSIPGLGPIMGLASANNNQQAVTHGVNTLGTIAATMGLGPIGGIISGIASMTGNGLGNIGVGQPGNSAANGSNANGGVGGMNGFGFGDIAGSLASLYGYNQANNSLNDYASQLGDMYGQNSPYAQQLKDQLARKDAAAGRRSQYGSRAVDLQAQLAQMMSRNAQPIFQARQAQNQMRGQGLAQLFALMSKSGLPQAGMRGIQDLLGRDPYGSNSGWGQDTLGAQGMGDIYNSGSGWGGDTLGGMGMPDQGGFQDILGEWGG